jgi:hypothetical protein
MAREGDEIRTPHQWLSMRAPFGALFRFGTISTWALAVTGEFAYPIRHFFESRKISLFSDSMQQTPISSIADQVPNPLELPAKHHYH